ncbi:hypothetical protein D3C74_425890 [compost metagenome]
MATVTAEPTTTAMKNITTWSTAPNTATIGPPWATLSPTFPSIAMTEPTIEPAIILGITRSGSWAAKGIAPSVIPNNPMVNVAFPASRSADANLRLLIIAARPIPIGGIHIATAIGPIIS